MKSPSSSSSFLGSSNNQSKALNIMETFQDQEIAKVFLKRNLKGKLVGPILSQEGFIIMTDYQVFYSHVQF